MAYKPGRPPNPFGLNLSDLRRNLMSEQEDPQRPSLSGLLGGLAWPPPPPPVIGDRWFKDQTLHVDGYTFERCRFDRCNLITEVATFSFSECVISPDCALYFRGPALKTVRLLMHALQIKDRIQVVPGEEELCAQINRDGTFTLR